MSKKGKDFDNVFSNAFGMNVPDEEDLEFLDEEDNDLEGFDEEGFDEEGFDEDADEFDDEDFY